MNSEKSRFRLRLMLITIVIFFTVITGGSMIFVNFLLETRQAERDVTGKLRLISEDVNIHTESFITFVQGRTFALGKMMETSILDFNKPGQIIHVGFEMLKNQTRFTSIELIDAASGSMVFIARDSEDKIVATTIYKDEKTSLFQTTIHENLDYPNFLERLVDKNSMDPRAGHYFKMLSETKKPDWTEVSPPSTHAQKLNQETLSYVYPVMKKDVFLGMVRIEIGLRDINHYLALQGERIGFDGAALMLERKTNGKVIVIGHEHHIHQFHQSPEELLAASDCTDPHVQALGKILNKCALAGMDAFNSLTTLDDKATDENGRMWNIAWTSVFPHQKPYWIIVTAARNDLLMAEAWRHIFSSMIILLLIMGAGIILAIIIARKMSLRLEMMSSDLIKVSQGEITPQSTDDYRIIEMYNLASGIEEMKTGLLSFRKFIPRDIVNQVVHSRKTANMFVEKKTITLFFSDLKNFTSLAESLDPAVLIDILGDHLAFCSSIIQNNHGTIDKFIGDSVMAFWNAPSAVENHAAMACIAALECQAAMKTFNETNKTRGFPQISMRIGIHTGEALVGNIGSNTRLNYTAVGDSVNLASRLEGTNKDYGTSILISQATNTLVQGKILTRLLDKVSVKGKTQPAEIYEVLGTVDDATPELLQRIELTNTARQHYEAREFTLARDCYLQLLNLDKEDGVAKLYIQRCDAFIANPPPVEWNAIIHKETK